MAVYGQTPILKKMTLMFLGSQLNPQLMKVLQEQFESVDRDDSGTISPEEFHYTIKNNLPDGTLMPIRSTNMLF